MNSPLNSGKSKPALVLLHGWGMHGGIWEALGASLAPAYRVLTPDLPGYGGKAACAPYDLARMAQSMWAELPAQTHVLGWSLGAQLALAMTQAAPQRVKKLILISATPSFRAREDWEHGLSDTAIAEFARGLEQDYRGTLQRFLSLQARSGEAARAIIAQLRGTLFARGTPALETLRGGLAILSQADMRDDLADIPHPSLVLHGSHDTLVPLAAGEALARALPQAQIQVFKGAAHAPFLSHPIAVGDSIRRFLDD